MPKHAVLAPPDTHRFVNPLASELEFGSLHPTLAGSLVPAADSLAAMSASTEWAFSPNTV